MYMKDSSSADDRPLSKGQQAGSERHIYMILPSLIWLSSWSHLLGDLLQLVTTESPCANCKMPKRLKSTSGKICDENVDMIAMDNKSIFTLSERLTMGQKLYMRQLALLILKVKEMLFEDDIPKPKVENQLGKKKSRLYEVIEEDELWLHSPTLVRSMEIRHEFTAPYSPQQNGIAERKNRTLKEMVTAMLISSGMSQDMWGEAILTATYLLNKIPRKEKEETPYEYGMERKTIISILTSVGLFSQGNGSSSRLDDKVVQDKRQRDDNDLQDERQDQTDEEEVEPRRSKRARNEKSFGPDFVSFMVENEPTSYRFSGYKWIFKKKMKSDGTIDKYKARLVIKGFRQSEGLDYFDTYSPVTRITSIRMIIAIAALRNLEIHQMDVKNAFPKRDLEEKIYMNQPEGFTAPGQEGKVCRLVKSLYGLKQAPKQWHQKFDNTMLESGFKINECDKHPAVIEGYSNANWISDNKVLESTSDEITNVIEKWVVASKGICGAQFLKLCRTRHSSIDHDEHDYDLDKRPAESDGKVQAQQAREGVKGVTPSARA
ncbi:retrovirus-related pol polyprotein from transposon TNT 1-94 [Tanacetum coccineum]